MTATVTRATASRYRLEPLAAEVAARWDELIRRYESTELFHQRPWLDYLIASRGVDIRYWTLQEAGQTIGYFCGGLFRKGPFRILGSPLKGWGTNYMGPIVHRDIDQQQFLRAVDDLAAREGLAMVELEYRGADEGVLAAAGFAPGSAWTYVVDLHADHDRMWKSLDAARRTAIRKAMKGNLTVEDCDDPGMADDFYDQYTDVMARKGLVPPYPREFARLLFHHLKKADMLFALRVRDNTGRVVATGLLPHDHRDMYFWGGASLVDGYRLCANDLMQWTAMGLAADRGLSRYDMSGNGAFKKKFGGALIEVKRWHKSYWRTARWARRGYELYFEKRSRLEGWWRRRSVSGGTEDA